MMTPIAKFVACVLLMTVLVYTAVEPSAGLLYQSPLACIGLGLIGLGLILQNRQQHVRKTCQRSS